jgi:hypothetical protein
MRMRMGMGMWWGGMEEEMGMDIGGLGRIITRWRVLGWMLLMCGKLEGDERALEYGRVAMLLYGRVGMTTMIGVDRQWG